MERLSSLFLIVFAGLILVDCSKATKKYVYIQDDRLSKSNGDPIDSLSFFFPEKLNYTDTVIETKLDTSSLVWYSSQIRPTNEKILFNYYLGFDCYRFTWLRSFHNPIVITLNRKGDHFWLTTKMLDRKPQFMGYVIRELPSSEKGTIDTTERIIMPNGYAELKINETKELSTDEWKEFERLLTNCDYWKMFPTLHDQLPGLDGSRWIIEAHFEDKYWIVDRWTPNDNYKQVGLYLIKLSGLDEKIY